MSDEYHPIKKRKRPKCCMLSFKVILVLLITWAILSIGGFQIVYYLLLKFEVMYFFSDFLHAKCYTDIDKLDRLCQFGGDFLDALNKNDVDYIIDFGSLLGAYWYEDILPWDGDIDISYFPGSEEKLERAILEIKEKYDGVKTWNNHVQWKDSIVDLFPWRKDGNMFRTKDIREGKWWGKLWKAIFYDFDESWYNSKGTMKFLGKDAKMFGNIDGFLTKRFPISRGWLMPYRIKCWSSWLEAPPKKKRVCGKYSK